MKYKLRSDYLFFIGKDEPLKNKLDKDGAVIESVIIDDKVYSVEGQLHKLEIVKEVEVDTGISKQGNHEPESALPKSGNKVGK